MDTDITAIKQLRSQAKDFAHQLCTVRNEAKSARHTAWFFTLICVRIPVYLRHDAYEMRTQCAKYELRLEHALAEIKDLRINARGAESRCRELDEALSRARNECRELRAAGSECSRRLSVIHRVQNVEYRRFQQQFRSNNHKLERECESLSHYWCLQIIGRCGRAGCPQSPEHSITEGLWEGMYGVTH